MVRTASLFSQLLELFPRLEFAQVVKRHQGERRAKGFTCWQQFVAMLFAQLAGAHSLREVCGGLQGCLGKLAHLGITGAPKRATLAYANEHRPWQLYQELFYLLLQKVRTTSTEGRGHKLRFRTKLLSLDASVIELGLSLFPWADFNRTNGAVKLHCLLDHADYLPSYVHLTLATESDLAVARLLQLPKGSLVVCDKGYRDYALWGRWSREGIFFVTRLATNTVYRVVTRHQVPQRGNIRADELITLTSKRARAQECTQVLRRVVVWLPEKQEELVLLTNHLRFGASTLAAIYKERWQIELFFKALKQSLHLKHFLGTSKNALFIQLWTALIAMLLLKWLQFQSRFPWSLSNLVALLRRNLMTYRDLHEWLNDPFQIPPATPPPVQYRLFAFGQQPA
jgi:hypothetical protein